MKRVEFEDYKTELAHRLAIAESSVFAGVTYGSAEKMMNAVHNGKAPGKFWLDLAELVMANRAEAKATRHGKKTAEGELGLLDSIELWAARGFRLVSFSWLNPKTDELTFSFNSEVEEKLHRRFAEKLRIPFVERNLLDDFKKE
jgi:hypothetical protein